MGQSSNKPIRSTENDKQSEIQLESVDEGRKLVQIRSEDVSTQVQSCIIYNRGSVHCKC